VSYEDGLKKSISEPHSVRLAAIFMNSKCPFGSLSRLWHDSSDSSVACKSFFM
jgi:hypothetical protein